MDTMDARKLRRFEPRHFASHVGGEKIGFHQFAPEGAGGLHAGSFTRVEGDGAVVADARAGDDWPAIGQRAVIVAPPEALIFATRKPPPGIAGSILAKAM
jgi:hypothetical protein